MNVHSLIIYVNSSIIGGYRICEQPCRLIPTQFGFLPDCISLPKPENLRTKFNTNNVFTIYKNITKNKNALPHFTLEITESMVYMYKVKTDWGLAFPLIK